MCQEICQEIKRLGLQGVEDDDALISRSSRCVPLSESSDLFCYDQRRNGASLMGQNKWSGGAATAAAAAATSHASSQRY
jgi:hypothetical protein